MSNRDRSFSPESSLGSLPLGTEATVNLMGRLGGFEESAALIKEKGIQENSRDRIVAFI